MTLLSSAEDAFLFNSEFRRVSRRNRRKNTEKITLISDMPITVFHFAFQNDDSPIFRVCYDSMRHEQEGDVVKPRDCIVLASGHRKRDLPFIAKVTSLWENPEDGK